MENDRITASTETPLDVSDARVTSASGVSMPKDSHLDEADQRIRSSKTIPMPQVSILDFTDPRNRSNLRAYLAPDTELNATDKRVRSAQRMSVAPDTELNATGKRVRSNEGASNIEDGVIENQSKADFSAPAEDSSNATFDFNASKAITEEDFKENFAYAAALDAMNNSEIWADTQDNHL